MCVKIQFGITCLILAHLPLIDIYNIFVMLCLGVIPNLVDNYRSQNKKKYFFYAAIPILHMINFALSICFVLTFNSPPTMTNIKTNYSNVSCISFTSIEIRLNSYSFIYLRSFGTKILLLN